MSEELEKELNTLLMNTSLEFQYFMDLSGSIQTRSYIKSVQGIKKIRGARAEATECFRLLTKYIVGLEELECKFEKESHELERAMYLKSLEVKTHE